MGFKDIRIGTQLRLGMGLILLLVIGLGALAKVQTDQIWLQTRNLYDHPLTVRRALGALEHNLLTIRLGMKDIALGESDQAVATTLGEIEIHRTDILRQFEILDSNYLGPHEDVVMLRDEFDKWNTLRGESIRMLQAGDAAAVARTKHGGVGNDQAEKVMAQFNKIDAFARNKAEQLLQDATALNETLNRNLLILVTSILVLSMAVAWWLFKGIKDPLQQLGDLMDQFRRGKLEARSQYASANEFGVLAASFNAMADTIQTEIQSNENAAQLSGVMLREEEVHGFCRELLKDLLLHTGSQVGAVYFVNEAKTSFELFDSIGMNTNARATFSATDLEGELGAALATRQIQRITAIPADTRFTFASVSGEFTPREILTIPVPSDHHVSAVISLASIHPYDTGSMRLVNDIWSVLTARMNGVLAFRKIQVFADRLEHQNRELDAQKRELVAQSNELTQQNTELEMQKRRLDEANRLKSTFLSNMSHELRTPLNSVIALAGVLNRRLEKTIPQEEHSYLEVIERNGKNLLALINDILDLSRIEAGREEINVSNFSLRDLVGEITAMLEPQAVEKNLALTNRVSGDLPFITSDHHKCLHILQNLMGNAVKFTESGSIEVSAQAANGNLNVAVRDTGIGIAPDQFPHIFDEFRQADDSNSRKFGGTGLGLAIAKKYASLLGGTITVESEPGQGSTFTLRLPMEVSSKAKTTAGGWPATGLTTRPAAALSGHGQNILLVEDSEPAVIQLTDILVRQGYHLHVARNGKEALALIEHTLPDAMILDLMMPEVDGFQVLKVIRNLERTARIPVLILTAKHVTKEELSFLTGNHIHQLIQKGNVDQHELLTAVATMVAPLSETPGSTPAAPLPETPAPRVAPRQRPGLTGKRLVLVVEDNPDSLLTAKALLQDHYQVLEATDGQAGVEQARRHRPDLILLDISMPVMDGIQALQELRKDETLRHIPVIALTASAMRGDRETILAYGFDDYLSKPLDAELLHETLRKAFD
jgi:signal transduction histidine kinase/DNA-binding response OmpR family regulator/HAMP domain-containing protein